MKKETWVDASLWVHSQGLHKVPPAVWGLSDGSVSQSKALEGNNHKDLIFYPFLIAFFFFQELLKTTSTMKFQIDSFCPNADGQKSIYSLGHTSYRPGNKTVTVRETSKFLSHPTGWLILEMFLSHIGIQPEWISQSCSKKLGLVPDCTSTASEWSLDIYTQFHHHSNQKPAVPISDLYHY